MKRVQHLKIIFTITTILIFAPFIAVAQTQATSKIPIYFSPLNPNRPDFIDLEVSEGTTSVKITSSVYNKSKKNYSIKGIHTIKLNSIGMITYMKKEKKANAREYEVEYSTYDSLNRLIKKERFIITDNDTLSQISNISYSGTNPLMVKWETDMKVFFEKMYFDKQGVVTKKETMKTLHDQKSIYSTETYNPLTQQGTFIEFYTEGGSSKYNITYKDGKKVSEVALDAKTGFQSERITRDTLGNIIRIQKKYTENSTELTYLEKRLYFLDTLWLGAICTVDYDANLDKHETLFMFREIINSSGKIKPSKEIADKILNEVENPKSKLPF